jgi:hypothetical protein
VFVRTLGKSNLRGFSIAMILDQLAPWQAQNPTERRKEDVPGRRMKSAASGKAAEVISAAAIEQLSLSGWPRTVALSVVKVLTNGLATIPMAAANVPQMATRRTSFISKGS